MEKRTNQFGFSLIFVIVSIASLSLISIGIQKLFSTSIINELAATGINKARYLSDSGINYVQSLNYKFENTSGKTLDDLITDLGTTDSPKKYTVSTGLFEISSAITDASTNKFQVIVTGISDTSTTPYKHQRTVTLQFNSVQSDKGIWYQSFEPSTVSGSTITDLWNNLTGTIIGKASVNATGVIGKALETSGSGCQSVSMSYTNALNWTPAGTIMLWIKIDKFYDWAGVLHKGDSSHPNSPYGVFDDEVWSLQFSQNGYLKTIGLENSKNDNGQKRLLFALIKSNTEVAFLATNTIFTTNTWHHVAVTYNSDGMHFYINGYLDSSTTSYVVPRQNTSSITIGAQTSTGSCYTLDGKIDEVQAWGRVLSLSSTNLSEETIEKEYCRGAQSLNIDTTRCKKYSY